MKEKLIGIFTAVANAFDRLKEKLGGEAASYKAKQEIKPEAEPETDIPEIAIPEMPSYLSSIGNLAEKSDKAAKDTRAAWEKAAEQIGIRLAQIRTGFEITGNQLDMTGTKAEQLRNTMASLTAQIEQQGKIIDATNAGYEKMAAEKGENSEEAQQLKLKLLEEKKALSDMEKQLFETNQALEEHAKEFRDLADEVSKVEKKYTDDMAAALAEYQKKVKETNDSIRKDTETLHRDLETKLDDIRAKGADRERQATEQFERELETRTNSLINFVGIFDEVTQKTVSGDSLLANLKGQVAAFDNWQENIQALAARGIDKGLLQELREMGPKSGAEIAALNSLTDEQLTQYAELWKQKQEQARIEATAQLAQQRQEMNQQLYDIRQDTQTQLEQQRQEMAIKLQQMQAKAKEELEKYKQDWEKKNAEIRKNTDEELARIQEKFETLAKNSTRFGQDFVLGFVGGMESQFERLREAAMEMASIVSSGVTDPLRIASPSKLMAGYGKNVVEGLIEGIKASLSNLSGAMSAMSGLVVPDIGAIREGMNRSYAPVTYGPTTYNISIQGANADEVMEKLKRELHRAGGGW